VWWWLRGFGLRSSDTRPCRAMMDEIAIPRRHTTESCQTLATIPSPTQRHVKPSTPLRCARHHQAERRRAQLPSPSTPPTGPASKQAKPPLPRLHSLRSEFPFPSGNAIAGDHRRGEAASRSALPGCQRAGSGRRLTVSQTPWGAGLRLSSWLSTMF
jgi:hypothetical protein